MTIATIPSTGLDRRPARDGAARRPHVRRATGRALPPADDAPSGRVPLSAAQPTEANHG